MLILCITDQLLRNHLQRQENKIFVVTLARRIMLICRRIMLCIFQDLIAGVSRHLAISSEMFGFNCFPLALKFCVSDN